MSEQGQGQNQPDATGGVPEAFRDVLAGITAREHRRETEIDPECMVALARALGRAYLALKDEIGADDHMAMHLVPTLAEMFLVVSE